MQLCQSYTKWRCILVRHTKVYKSTSWGAVKQCGKSHDGEGGDWADLKMVTKSCICWIAFLVDSSVCSSSVWFAAWAYERRFQTVNVSRAQTVRTLCGLRLSLPLFIYCEQKHTFIILSPCSDHGTACQACSSSTYHLKIKLLPHSKHPVSITKKNNLLFKDIMADN
jgi:hypothetical protein